MKNKLFLSFFIVFCAISAMAQEMSIADIDNELYCQDLTLKLSGKRTDDFPFSAIYGDWLISVDATKGACGNYGCYGKLENKKNGQGFTKAFDCSNEKDGLVNCSINRQFWNFDKQENGLFISLECRGKKIILDKSLCKDCNCLLMFDGTKQPLKQKCKFFDDNHITCFTYNGYEDIYIGQYDDIAERWENCNL